MEVLNNFNKELKKLDEIKQNQNNDQIKKIQLILQKNNIQLAFFKDVAPKVVKIWNKYDNKRAGEATLEKLKDELEKAFNNQLFIYVSNSKYQYPNIQIYITTKDATSQFTGDYKITIFSNKALINEENKFCKIDIEDLRIEQKKYIEDTETTAKEILKAHQEALELQKKINDIRATINDLSNYKINAIQYTGTVSNWL